MGHGICDTVRCEGHDPDGVTIRGIVDGLGRASREDAISTGRSMAIGDISIQQDEIPSVDPVARIVMDHVAGDHRTIRQQRAAHAISHVDPLGVAEDLVILNKASGRS